MVGALYMRRAEPQPTIHEWRYELLRSHTLYEWHPEWLLIYSPLMSVVVSSFVVDMLVLMMNPVGSQAVELWNPFYRRLLDICT